MRRRQSVVAEQTFAKSTGGTLSDAENTGVTEAVTEPETSAIEPREDAHTEAVASPSAEEQARNFKELRGITKELHERNRALEAEVAHMRAPAPEPESDEFDSLADDDIVTKKQVLEREKRLEARLSKFQASTAEDRLQSTCKDFKEVVSPENIEYLKNRYPDLAKSLASNSDTYSQGKAAYDLIVSLGINNKDAAVNKQKMQENSQKPRLAATASKAGPLDSAHIFESGQRPDLSKNLRAQLWAETQAAAKNQ